MIKKTISATLFTILGCVAISAQTGTWATKAPISSPRYFAEAAVVNGVLYAVGGWNGCGPYADLEAYDAGTDTWTPRAPMPTARGYSPVAELNGLLYAVGGSVGCGAGIANVDAYDPSTNTWSPRASLPTARYGHMAAVTGGKLYAIGGSYSNGSAQVDLMTEYDPVTNTWTDRAPMPTPRYNAAVAVVNDLIYVIGGGNYSNGALATVDVYDPATDTWSARAPMPLGRQSLDGSVLNGLIYVVGGSGGCTGLTNVDVYDPATDMWSTGTALPAPRQDFGIATLSGKIYVVAGYELYVCAGVNERSVSSVFEFTPDVDSIAPTATITSPVDGATFLLGQSVAADYSCEDEAGGSGLASCVGPVPQGSLVDTSSVGAKTFTVNATDNAGNAISVTVTYNVIYSFAGFFQPVDNLPALNVATAGSSIPLKFGLNGNQGLEIFKVGYPASGQVPCSANEPGSEVNETASSGASTLSYNESSDQYTYVWKTNKVWKGTCRILVVRLKDGTDHLAKFKFK